MFTQIRVSNMYVVFGSIRNMFSISFLIHLFSRQTQLITFLPVIFHLFSDLLNLLSINITQRSKAFLFRSHNCQGQRDTFSNKNDSLLLQTKHCRNIPHSQPAGQPRSSPGRGRHLVSGGWSLVFGKEASGLEIIKSGGLNCCEGSGQQSLQLRAIVEYC